MLCRTKLKIQVTQVAANLKKQNLKKKTKNEMAAAVGGEYYVPLQNTG